MTHKRPVPSCILVTVVVIVCATVIVVFHDVIAWEGSCGLGLVVEAGSPSTRETQLELEFGSDASNLGLEVTFEGNVWDELKIEAAVGIGDLTFDSELVFEPDRNRWKRWTCECEWSTDSMTLGVTWKPSRTTDWLTFELEQKSKLADVDTRLRLRAPTGSCVFVFYDFDLEVGFAWCGIDSAIAVAFDDDGFDELAFEWSDVTLDVLSGVSFDIEAVIDPTEWEFEVDPTLSATIGGCLEIEIEAELPGFPHLGEVRDVEVVASWECSPWETEVTIRLDPDDWIDDLYCLEVEADLEIDLVPCGELAMTVVFDWTETTLGRVEVECTWSLTERVSLGCDVTRDMETGQLEEVAFNLEFEW